jgi:hypothetical protein
MVKKQNKDTQKFHIGDILGVMTGIACAPNSFTGVCSLLKFMTGESPYTTQAARFADECLPYLKEQFPQFAEIQPDILRGAGNAGMVKLLAEKFGEYHEVRKIHPEDHVVMNPIEEFARDYPDVPFDTIDLTDEEN